MWTARRKPEIGSPERARKPLKTLSFATRLNSFASRPQAAWPDLEGKPSVLQMAERAARVEGLTHLDLNYPDHLGQSASRMARQIGDLGLAVNGLAMRYYTNPAFRLGAFTNPDHGVRREAIDLSKRGIDAAMEAGAPLINTMAAKSCCGMHPI